MSFLIQCLIFAPFYTALFWAVLLMKIPSRISREKHFLGVFMVATTVVYGSHALYFTNNYRYYVFVDALYLFAQLSVYPLFLLYIEHLTQYGQVQKRYFYYALPGMVLALSSGLIYLFMESPVDYVRDILFNPAGSSQSLSKLWKWQNGIHTLSRFLFFIQVVGCLIFGIRLINQYNKRIKDFYSNMEGRSIDWVKWLMLIFALTALMSFGVNFLGRSFFIIHQGWLLFPSLIFSILIFLIGYLGFHQTHSMLDLSKDEKEGEDAIPFEQSDKSVSDHRLLFIALKRQLLTLFEKEKVYCNSDLKISMISQILKTNRTYISSLINEEFACSFSDFVNRYRIEEAKRLLSDQLEQSNTLEEIAEKSGFTSAGSLIRVFKQFEGITPGVYRNQQQKKILDQNP